MNFFIETNSESATIKIINKSTIFSIIILTYERNKFKKEIITNNKYCKIINKANTNYINKNFLGIKKNNRYYKINLNNFKLSNKYANIKRFLNQSQFKELLSLSYFVGMVCPGLNSILSSLDINLDNKIIKNNNIKFFLKKFDKRINLLQINFSNSIFGKINSFTYSGEVAQPSIKKIKKYVNEKEFLGTNSLIIGGSRGLGELTAKILVSGGANITATYYQGVTEAKKLKQNIERETSQNCNITKLNVLDKNFKNEIKKLLKHDFIFYYPTPKIFNTKNENFDFKKFKYYYKFYVKKFIELCRAIERYSDKQIIIFYPSTIYVLSQLDNFKEYVKAKLVAEKKIKEINQNFKKVKIISNRLPQLDTDQTAGIIKTFKSNNIKIMIPIIRSLISNKKNGKSFYLRSLSEKDINKKYLSWLKDPSVNQYLDVRFVIPSQKQAVENLLGYDNKKNFFRGIFDKKNNKFIGTATLRKNPQKKREAIYGYLIGERSYWGTKAGIEAFALNIDFAFINLGLSKIVGGTYSNNIGSIFNFYKLGFTKERRLKKHGTFKGAPIDRLIFSMSKKKWFKLRKKLNY